MYGEVELHGIGFVSAGLSEFDGLLIVYFGGDCVTRSRPSSGLLGSEGNKVAELVVVQAVMHDLEEQSPRNQRTEHSPRVRVAIVECGIENIVATKLHAHACEGLGVVHLVDIAVKRVL